MRSQSELKKMISAVIGECPRIDRRKPSSKSVSVNTFECPAKSGDRHDKQTRSRAMRGPTLSGDLSCWWSPPQIQKGA
jgi:hypothetical protein